MNNKENYIIENINNVMDITNTRSASEMAKRIGVPVTTWRSFMNNPSSNSIAKTKFCLYYGLTVKQIESDLLDDDLIKELVNKVNNNDKKKQEIAITEITDEDLQLMFENSDSKSDEFFELKRKVIDKASLSFKANLENAKNRSIEKPTEALALFNGVFALMKEEEVKLLTQSDLKTYIDLTVDDGNLNGLERLIETLTSDGYYDYKVVSVLALLLEEVGLTKQAKQCLKAVLDK